MEKQTAAVAPQTSKVYILSEAMRASKSGFYIEGTDIEMDYPDEYPLPLSTEIIENGKPMGLRIIPFCDSIVVEEQIQKGFPREYAFTEADRMKLTFKYGRLELSTVHDKIYIDYLDRTGWLKGNEKNKRYLNTRTVYEVYDEESIIQAEIDDEEQIIKAKGHILGLKDSQIRDLYKLAVGANFQENNITLKHMKRHLLNISEANPDFIVEGVKKGRDEIVVLLNKAIEYKIVGLNFAGLVGIKRDSSGEDMDPWFEVSDAGNSEAKFNRALGVLSAEEGKSFLIELKDLVTKYEEHLIEN